MTEFATDVAIELCGVSKNYRYFTLDNIHLKLPRGQIMGLIGANGAGKSTTIRIVMGLVHQDSGDARMLGHSMPNRLLPNGTSVSHRRTCVCTFP